MHLKGRAKRNDQHLSSDPSSSSWTLLEFVQRFPQQKRHWSGKPGTSFCFQFFFFFFNLEEKVQDYRRLRTLFFKGPQAQTEACLTSQSINQSTRIYKGLNHIHRRRVLTVARKNSPVWRNLEQSPTLAICSYQLGWIGKAKIEVHWFIMAQLFPNWILCPIAWTKNGLDRVHTFLVVWERFTVELCWTMMCFTTWLFASFLNNI